MFLLTIIGYILLGFVMILAAMIFIPYHYQAVAENLGHSQMKGSVSWLFGGIRMEFIKYPKRKAETTLIILGLTKKFQERPDSKKEDQKKFGIASKNNAKKNLHTDSVKDSISAQKRHQNEFGIRQFLRTDVLKKILASLRKIARHILPDQLIVNAKIGFSDPMYTGFLSVLLTQGYLWYDRFDIAVELVFGQEMLEGRFFIGGRIWLPYLLSVIIGLLVTKPIRNIMLTNLKIKLFKGGSPYVG